MIKAPLAHVWHFIKLQDFSKFWSAVSKSEYVKGASEETDIVKWSFKDGTELEVKQEEHSVSVYEVLEGPGTNTESRRSTTSSPTASSPLSLSSRTRVC